MNEKNEHLDCCEFYWRSACLWKKYAVVERLENEDGAPIGMAVVEGEQCRYSKCPYRGYVGINRQNQK